VAEAVKDNPMEMEKDQLRETIETGSVLIRSGVSLPHGVQVISESFVPGWKMVTDRDGATLDREIHKAGWRYFCLATVITATTFGKTRQKMIRRAIERILNNPKLEPFNSLQIVEVGDHRRIALSRLGRVTVLAQPRHIQQSLFLSADARFDLDGVESTRVAGGKSVTDIATAKKLGEPLEEMAT
jgi:hypothetical protein